MAGPAPHPRFQAGSINGSSKSSCGPEQRHIWFGIIWFSIGVVCGMSLSLHINVQMHSPKRIHHHHHHTAIAPGANTVQGIQEGGSLDVMSQSGGKQDHTSGASRAGSAASSDGGATGHGAKSEKLSTRGSGAGRFSDRTSSSSSSSVSSSSSAARGSAGSSGSGKKGRGHVVHISDAAGVPIEIPDKLGMSDKHQKSDVAISEIEPSHGRIKGGFKMVIKGSGFAKNTTVLIGDQICSKIKVKSNNKLRCNVPSGSGKGLDVRVISAHGSAVRAGAFDYDPPTVFQVDPPYGEPAGGQKITLTGENFGLSAPQSIKVSLGGSYACASPKWLGDDKIECVTPPGKGVAHAVTVTINGQPGMGAGAYSFEIPKESDHHRFHANSCGNFVKPFRAAKKYSCPAKDMRCMYKANSKEAEDWIFHSMPCQEGLTDLKTLKKAVEMDPNKLQQVCSTRGAQCKKDLLGCIPGEVKDKSIISRAKIEDNHRFGYTVELLHFRSRIDGHTVVGLFAKPKGKSLEPGGKRPLVIAVHGIGLLPDNTMCVNRGACNDYMKQIGQRMVKQGFAVWAPFIYSKDSWVGRYESYSWHVGEGPFGILAAKLMASIDVLGHHDEFAVDIKRVGGYGISWGGNIIRATAIADPRMTVVAVSGNPGTASGMMTSKQTSFAGLTTGTPLGPPGFWCRCDYGFLYACLIRPRVLILEMGKKDKYLSWKTGDLKPILDFFWKHSGASDKIHLVQHNMAHEMSRGNEVINLFKKYFKPVAPKAPPPPPAPPVRRPGHKKKDKKKKDKKKKDKKKKDKKHTDHHSSSSSAQHHSSGASSSSVHHSSHSSHASSAASSVASSSVHHSSSSSTSSHHSSTSSASSGASGASGKQGSSDETPDW